MLRQTHWTDGDGGVDGVGEAQQGKVVFEAPAVELLMDDDLQHCPHHAALLHALGEVVTP